jgi:tRNA pseudouridine38-40 synthase
VKDLRHRVTVLVRFGYDGARFFGLQPQPGVPTAGAALEARLAAAAGQPAKGLAFSARTDRGVHAEKNLATCFFLTGVVKGVDHGVVDVDAVRAAVVVDRDDGIGVVELLPIPPTVHARSVSRGKHYRYRVRAVDVDSVDVDTDGHRWLVVPHIDVVQMRAAAAQLVGHHDFTSFRGGGCTAASAEKHVWRIDVDEADGDVVVDICGDAFLRKMVRNVMGVLVEVGTGWRAASDVADILAAKDRRRAGLCAPPEGLTLVQVGSAWPDDGSWLLPDERGPAR